MLLRYAGDVWTCTWTWTWTALKRKYLKLIVTWLVVGRDSGYAIELMDDLRARDANRVQLNTDGHRA